MAIKQFTLDGIGEIRVQKRRGTKHMRIRLASDGKVSVSLPYWLPFSAGIDFAKHHREWITKHRTPEKVMRSGMKIGNGYQLNFIRGSSATASARMNGNVVIVRVPSNKLISDASVQAAARRGAKKALEAEAYILGQRLAELAAQHGFHYSEVRYKFMKSKWGSCHTDKTITLNYRLLDLPVELRDYVMIHELAHTKEMNHSQHFWDIVGSVLPNYKQSRKKLKTSVLSW